MFLKKSVFSIKLLLLFVCFSCNKEPNIDLKSGTFQIVHDDATVSHVIRDGNFQIKYSLNRPSEVQIFKVNWKNKSEYVLEVINKKSKFDSFPLFVKISNIEKNISYETIYLDAVNLKFSQELEKISDSISPKFIDVVSQHKNKTVL